MKKNLLIMLLYLCTVIMLYTGDLFNYKFLALYTFLAVCDIFLIKNEKIQRMFKMTVIASVSGFLIEYLGSIFKLWTFANNETPPVYVVFSWPLVYFFMYGLTKAVDENEK